MVKHYVTTTQSTGGWGTYLDLVRPTEDVCIVLLEPPHPGQPGQGAWQLVPVQDPEVGHAQGQLLVGPRPVVEKMAVAGAVHGLQAKRFLLNIKPGKKKL